MYQLLLPILFAASVLAAGPASLPSNFKLCSKSDSDFANCLKIALQDALPILKDGVRPLGVLPIDPLQLTSLGINQGEGPVAINLEFTNPSIHGLSKLKIEEVKPQLDGDTKELTITVTASDIVTLEGQYKINGNVLILNISGTGQSKIELVGADATFTFSGKIAKKDGFEYLGFDRANLVLNAKKVRFNFENLFNGDKALGDNMNKFLNENWEVVYSELRKSIQDVFGYTFIGIANRMMTKVPYDKVFLP